MKVASLRRKRKKRSIKSGLPPGSLIHIGSPKTTAAKLSIYRYTTDTFIEQQNCTFEAMKQERGQPGIKWIEVDGVHDIELVKKIGEEFQIHSLVLEDILNTDQRPKKEDFGTCSYFVLKMVRLTGDQSVEVEQLSLVLGNDYLITFQEGEADCFDMVRQRLRTNHSKYRSQGADFLLYSLMDLVVDQFFEVLEKVGESLDDLEEELVTLPTRETLSRIYSMKRCILLLRRSIWPVRELLSIINRGELNLIQQSSLLYFRDIYDHTVEIIDIIENAREISASMIDVYLSSISNRLNDVMRLLTVITTIFMPLSFVVGLYGMNFEHMPELHWKYGYLMVLAVIAMITASMTYFFKKKGWLSPPPD